MNINITQIKTVCRNAAQEYLHEAEIQTEREKSKNRFVSWSGHDRKREALQIAHQLFEFADGRRGLIAKAIRQHAETFKGKRQTEFLISLGRCGAKIGGFIHQKGKQPQVVLALDRDLNAKVYGGVTRKVDWNYGD